MPLVADDTGLYIATLDANQPEDSDDYQKSAAEQRWVKAVLQRQFENFAGVAITATEAEINQLANASSNIQDQLDTKLPTTSYTAADVLAKLLTVDGSGSGLDADTLDGTQLSTLNANIAAKANATNAVFYGNLPTYSGQNLATQNYVTGLGYISAGQANSVTEGMVNWENVGTGSVTLTPYTGTHTFTAGLYMAIAGGSTRSLSWSVNSGSSYGTAGEWTGGVVFSNGGVVIKNTSASFCDLSWIKLA